MLTAAVSVGCFYHASVILDKSDPSELVNYFLTVQITAYLVRWDPRSLRLQYIPSPTGAPADLLLRLSCSEDLPGSPPLTLLYQETGSSMSYQIPPLPHCGHSVQLLGYWSVEGKAKLSFR